MVARIESGVWRSEESEVYIGTWEDMEEGRRG